MILGTAGNVVAQNIASTWGTAVLMSTSGTVTANGAVNGGDGVAISASQNITTGQINSWGGTVSLDAKQDTVTITGDVATVGADVYFSSAGDVVSQNIISNGGAITVVSKQGSLTTGYLRSDGNSTGGKIYLRASGLIRVNGSFSIKFVQKTPLDLFPNLPSKLLHEPTAY